MMNDERAALLVERDDGTLHLTLNRPQSRNAINWDMRRALAAALREDAWDQHVRLVVIRGAGGTFCAGGDIRQMGQGREDSLKKLEVAGEIITSISALEKPVVAIVEGHAAGAGMSLALACDLVVARDDAQFHPSFVSRALAPDMSGSFWLTHQVGLHRAKRILLEGRSLTAAEAADLGLVSSVYTAADFEARVAEMIRSLSTGPTLAYAAIKRLINEAYGDGLAAQLRRESAAQLTLSMSEDHRAAIRAFAEKSQPRFDGR